MPKKQFGAEQIVALLRQHYLHLRCEVPMPKVVEDTTNLIGRPDVRLMSLMYHTPGQRQDHRREGNHGDCRQRTWHRYWQATAAPVPSGSR